MSVNRILEIWEQIDQLTLDLLGPLRFEKKVDDFSFRKLYVLLDELVSTIKGEVSIPRNLAGLLFFIYTSILAESQHAREPQPILKELWTLEEYLDKILWDSPFRTV